jgi:hypothetical protein
MHTDKTAALSVCICVHLWLHCLRSDAMYSRRDIGRLALASLPLARAFGKLDSHVNGVLIGAQSYSFRDRPLDAAIQGFIDVGLSECELSMGHVEPEFPRGAGRPRSAPQMAAECVARRHPRDPAKVRPGRHRTVRLRLQHPRRLHGRGNRARIRCGPGAGRPRDDDLGHGIGDAAHRRASRQIQDRGGHAWALEHQKIPTNSPSPRLSWKP